MVTKVSEMTDLVLGWADRNFQFCNLYSNLKEAADKNMKDWERQGYDVSETSEDLDVQSFRYVLNRVLDCKHQFDFLDLKAEVEMESNKRNDD